MKNLARYASIVFWPALAFTLISCASAPIGGPTPYASERIKQLPAPGPEGVTEDEELRFGLVCKGSMCSEKFDFGGLFGVVKESTPKLFAKKRRYRSLVWLASSECQDCDLIVRLTLERPIRAEVSSAYSHRTFYQTQIGGVGNLVTPLGTAVYDAFRPGGDLYRLVCAEREAHLKPVSAGLSQKDLEAIAKAVQQTGPAKKETEATTITSDVDKPQYQAPENPDNFAVVIGIEKYSELPSAQFAERDAEAVKAHLLAMGYPSRNIVFLTGEKAGRAGIEKYLERWLPRNTNENSRVFFYFCGHGAPDVKSGEAYLVPWDGDANYLETTGYSIKRLYEMLGKLKAKEVIVAMDACFSGAGGRSVLAQGARPLVTKLDSAAPQSGNIVSISASAASEITGTLQEQGHGIFTYYFLKGLGGAAQDASGHVTIKSLYDYLLPHVQDAARRQNRDQTPVLMSPASAAGAQTNLR